MQIDLNLHKNLIYSSCILIAASINKQDHFFTSSHRCKMVTVENKNPLSEADC